MVKVFVNDQYRVFEKDFGRRLTDQTFASGLNEFFVSCGLVTLNHLLDKLEDLLITLNSSPIQLIGASLLIAYEESHAANPKWNASLIDFAHSTIVDELQGPDAGVLLGLTNLYNSIKELVQARNPN